jgi:hypothetical protein
MWYTEDLNVRLIQHNDDMSAFTALRFPGNVIQNQIKRQDNAGQTGFTIHNNKSIFNRW